MHSWELVPHSVSLVHLHLAWGLKSARLAAGEKGVVKWGKPEPAGTHVEELGPASVSSTSKHATCRTWNPCSRSSRALSWSSRELAEDPGKPAEETHGGAAGGAAWLLPDASEVSDSKLQLQRDPERGF